MSVTDGTRVAPWLPEVAGGGFENALAGDTDPARVDGYPSHPPRMGFFTDTSVCIGCKACEVACKEWNRVPADGLEFTGMSYDNSVGLSADTWRHVKFIEQSKPLAWQDAGVSHECVDVFALAAQGSGTPQEQAGMTPTTPDGSGHQLRWLMASDVCKHCTHAACLDVCPTGSLFRTEFGTVVVQEDICNGCGYCVPACWPGRGVLYRGVDQQHRGARMARWLPGDAFRLRRVRRDGRGRARPAHRAVRRDVGQIAPARNLAVAGAAMETAAFERMERRIGMVAEPYSEGRGGRYVKIGKALAAAGVAGALLGGWSRAAAVLSGAALIAASAATRWGVYHAGMASSADPKYTVAPQRERLNERAAVRPDTPPVAAPAGRGNADG